MYMVVLQMLGLLWLAVVVASATGLLAYPIIDVLTSSVVILIATMVTSVLCALVTKVSAQHPSSFISGLIIFFIVTPGLDTPALVALVGASILAVASKYVLVYRKQHVMNPVAIGLVVLTMMGLGGASWWVATPVLLIPLLIAGAVTVTKIRKWSMVITFVLVGLLVFLFDEWRFGSDVTQTWSQFFLSYPTLFLAFFMLTEPFTTPGTKRLQIGYAVVVAFLANTALFADLFKMTPELALVIGNILFFVTSLKQKLFLTLISKQEIAPLVYEFTFNKPAGMKYKAGQYLEWMLPHGKTDSRGIRRYFSIASAPSESVLRLALKIPEKSSAYKKALLELPVGGEIIASQLSGDFVMPKNPEIKIGWIAGGIGVTPFISKAGHLKNTGDKRDIVLLYAAATQHDFVAIDKLETAASIIKVVGSGDVPVLAERGFVTSDLINKRVPDALDRTWYVSGPPGMVNASVAALIKIGVSRKRIVKDFFPGLA
jgi:ferredoxin-NADP reductase/Na+-translocating ferredoxin:NAD+ oxidoreductase RnfD subunit